MLIGKLNVIHFRNSGSLCVVMDKRLFARLLTCNFVTDNVCYRRDVLISNTGTIIGLHQQCTQNFSQTNLNQLRFYHLFLDHPIHNNIFVYLHRVQEPKFQVLKSKWDQLNVENLSLELCQYFKTLISSSF